MIKKKLDIVTIFLVLNFNIILQQQGGKRFSIFQENNPRSLIWDFFLWRTEIIGPNTWEIIWWTR